MKKLFLILIFTPLILISQNQTMGLFQYDQGSIDGYTLFSPNQETYLIDTVEN